jgi:hypothetical protein
MCGKRDSIVCGATFASAPRRARMQLELEAATRKLEASHTAHAELAERHEAVSARYEELRRQCKEVGARLGAWAG